MSRGFPVNHTHEASDPSGGVTNDFSGEADVWCSAMLISIRVLLADNG